ncbi:sensor histidine kinase [Ideonella sp. BN130291]|uniref:sensor histidine kinase n=1 Tax=Ideonella sp. BN130291 TaxID=3112940 RepID=UPI002E25E91D|nr:HAMP domain-containing sensor histidine kinase [Ideonella sp. BN130291]
MRLVWRWLASFRRRILFRTVFLLLALATLALAVAVLQQEKQLSYANYRVGVGRTQAQVLARLHHPSGQLALMNPQAATGTVPLAPVVLPFSALDFDDPAKVQQAVELAGCLVQYPGKGSVCVAVANNAWAGGFIYLAGSFASGDLAARARGERDVTLAHRVRVTLNLRGSEQRWIAPFEAADGRASAARRGRLTGFDDEGRWLAATRPQRDFRGWLWQDGACAQPAATLPGCERRAFFSIRLPVPAYQAALFDRSQPLVWPPADLGQARVRVEVLAPGEGAALLDSNDASAVPPFSIAELKPLLLPGETLKVMPPARAGSAAVFNLHGADSPLRTAPWLVRLVHRLPVEGYDAPIELRDRVDTALGPYEVVLTGDVRSVDATLAAVATRLSGFVGTMLLAIVLAWLLIEIGLIRRVAVLTRRARKVSRDVQDGQRLGELDVADLRGHDELGILAGALADLLQRVKEDLQRERLRAEREKDQWHAVGHEIMSPLQSLLALHGAPDDPSARYIHRMQQAVRVLYGSASPSEAFETTTLRVQPLDLHQFLRHVASNAPAEGIAQVELHAAAGLGPVMVRADEYPLEDVATHVLRNAARYRPPGTPIRLILSADADVAVLEVHNQGPPIPEALMARIFEYGVSDPESGGEGGGQRGQGLFVAKTYLAKMGGTITARNEADGVSFVLTLQRA